MARLWSCGFELQTLASGGEFLTAIGSPALETSLQRSGAAACRINNTVAEGFRNQHTVSQGAYFFRFYVYIVAMPAITSILGGFRITGANKVVVRLTSAGKLQLYNAEDSAQVGSDSSANLTTGVWYRIEISCDTTTLSSTAVEAMIDGVSFASGTVDLAANPTNIGCFHNGDTTLDYIVDDVAVNDNSGSFQNSWPGEGEIIHLFPNGNGDNSGWAGSDGNSTDNYLLVDETTPNGATDYVESNTANQIDDYELTATPSALASNDTINCVQVGVQAAVSDATGADPDIVLRIKASSGGTVQESSSLDVNAVAYQTPSPAPALTVYSLTLYDLPGASTTAWTKADLDSAQIGIREAVTDTHFARVSAIWLLVDHKPTTTYTQSVSGSLTSSGTVAKETHKPLAGALTMAGELGRETAKVLAGAISFAGNVSREPHKALSGALALSGTASRATSKRLAGAVTFAGEVRKLTRRALAGAISFIGTLISEYLAAGDVAPLPLTLAVRDAALELSAERTAVLTLAVRSNSLTLEDRDI